MVKTGMVKIAIIIEIYKILLTTEFTTYLLGSSLSSSGSALASGSSTTLLALFN